MKSWPCGLTSQSEAPHSDGLRSSIGERRHRIQDIKAWLARKISEALSPDFGLPTANPTNLAEIMKEDIEATNIEIEKLEGEIQVLTSLLKEASKLVMENRHPLESAEPVEEVKEEPTVPGWYIPIPNAPIEPRNVPRYLPVNI